MKRLNCLACITALVLAACGPEPPDGKSDLAPAAQADMATPPDLTVAADATPASTPDLGTMPDLSPIADLAVQPDLTMPPDLIVAADMAEAPKPDLAIVPDITVLPDLAMPSDLAPPPADLAPRPPCNNACTGGKTCVDDHCTCGAKTDCNGTCMDTKSDPTNCNGCGLKCPVGVNAQAQCLNGFCVLACKSGTADCNNNANDGCEASTNNVATCGACGVVCKTANGIPACTNGACAVASCDKNFADCNKNAKDGCESDTRFDDANCGGCNTKCSAVANGFTGCWYSQCLVWGCNSGYKDCDGNVGNGCEAYLATDAKNCGGCGNICGQGQVCSAGKCAFVCANGLTTCQDGCKDTTADTANCGGCGTQCSLVANATMACVKSNCSATCKAGYADCNQDAKDGCEVNTTNDAKNCGGCAVSCQSGICINGACQAPAPPPWSVTIEVSAPVSAEVHLWYADAGNGTSSYGLTPHKKTLTASEACKWGTEISAKVPSGDWLDYGCQMGTPSLTTLTVKVNGVVTMGTFVKHPWICKGGGEGNLFFSPAQLGCP